MVKHSSWKQIGRKTIYSTPHMRVYEDIVQVPNGNIIDDYSIVEFNDVVLVVATDSDGNVLVLDEYRYAVDQTLLNLPAGTIVRGQEEPLAAAKRELQEETGYTTDDIVKMGEFYEYATKATHICHVFRAKNAVKKYGTQHEDREQISLHLLRPEELKKAVFTGKVKTGSVLSSLLLAMPELFSKN